MALYVNYNQKMGEYKHPQKEGTKPLKCEVYACNALLACVYKKHTLDMFFADICHLKRCEDVIKQYSYDWKLNVYYKDMIKVAAALAKMGIKVTLYYDDGKEEKNGK